VNNSGIIVATERFRNLKDPNRLPGFDGALQHIMPYGRTKVMK
jgi:hypothetical protein